MPFNIFSGFFDFNKETNIKENAQAPSAQPVPIATRPTFIQQATKRVWMFGSFLSAWSTLNILSSATSDNDDRTSELEPLLTTSSTACAMGLFAFGTGQPAVQLAGLPLLTGCLNFPGARAYQSNVTFLTTVGGAGNDLVYSAQRSQDGGYIITGETTSSGAGNSDRFLTKFHPNGTLSWSKTLGGSGTDDGMCVQPTSDGGYIVIGQTSSYGAGGYDLFLTKFTSAGSVSWTKTVGGSNNEYGYSVQQTQDGGYIVTGWTNSFGAGNNDVLLAKFTSVGSLSWMKTLGGASNTEIGQSVQETQDGGYIITGYTISYGAGSTDLLLAKFTSTGTLSWTKTLGGPGAEEGRFVLETKDNGFIVVGYTNGFGAGNYDLLLAKYTSTGVLSWAKTVGGANNDYGASVQQTLDGEFIVIGHTTSYGAGNSDILLAKLGSTGNLLWAKTLGGISNEYGRAIQQTEDGGFVITGNIDSDIILAKLDKKGRILNCNATQTINPTVTDITGSVTITSPSPTVTTPSPTINTWAVSEMPQSLNQNMSCIGATRTRTKSLSIPETPTFLTTLGGVGEDGVGRFGGQQTQDGGFIVTGYTKSVGAGNADLLLTKFSSNGTVSWTKTLGGSGADYGHSVQQTQDGGYIVLGETTSVGAGNNDFLLVKLNSIGDVSWSKTLGGPATEIGYSVRQTQDGGFIVVGDTYSFGVASMEMLLAKFTATGALSWAKTLGGSGNQIGYNVQQTQDGDYIVTGFTGTAYADVLIARFTSTGTLSWVKQLGNSAIDIGYAVQETQDGGFIMTGTTYSFGAGDCDVLLAKFTSVGTLSWARTLGGPLADEGYDVKQTQDGGFIVTGYVTGFGSGSTDVLLAKFTSTGALSWAEILGGAGGDQGYFIQQTQDGGFVVGGSTYSFGSGGDANIFLAKLDGNGRIRHCNATQTINPTVTDITASIPISIPALTVTTPSPTVLNWAISTVSQNLTQNMTCPEKTKTQTRSLVIPKTPTFLTTVGVAGDYASSVQQTQDGGFIVTGYTNLGAGSKDLLLTKFTSNGMTSWSKTLGGGSDESGASVQQTQDGGYIVAGSTISFGAGLPDFLLTKFLSSGALSWAKTLGGGLSEAAYDVRQTQDGGYITVGSASSFGAGNNDVLLAKFTTTGSLSWAKTLGGTLSDVGRSVRQTQDGGYIVIGYTYSFGAGDADVFFAKLTSTGTLSWVKTLGGAGSEIGTAVQQTQDGGYIVIGTTASFGAGVGDVLLAKLSSTGTLSWAKTLGGGLSEYGNSIRQTQDGGFIVLGNTNGFGAGSNDILLAKFLSNGTLSWAKTLGGPNGEAGYSIQQTRDGGFVVAGTHASGLLLAKLDEYGNIARCTTTQTINPTVTDITASITVTSPAPTVTTPSPTVLNWAVSAVSQNLDQIVLCPRNSTTISASPDKTRTISSSNDLSLSATHSHLSSSRSRPESLSTTPMSSSSHSFLSSQTSSRKLSESQSLQVIKTRTKQATRTRPVRRSTSVLIQESNLPMTGITQTQLSPSGSLVLTKTSTGLQFIKVNHDGTMTPAGQFAISGTIQATTFSQDEKYMFVANNQGNIQIIDLHDPNHPKSLGFVSAGSPIQSLAISGDGTQLLVGTNTGVNVISAKTPVDPKTMTLVTSYPTATPVNTIQTNPNTNLVSIGSGNNVTLLNYKNNQFTKLSQKTVTDPIISISPINLADPDQLTLKLSNGDTIVLNIANPTSITVTSTLVGSSATLTAISGSTLLVAGVKPGIQIFESAKKDWQTASEAGYTPVTGTVTSLSFSSDGKYGIYSDVQGVKLIKVIKDPGRLDVPLPRLLNVVKLGFSMSNILLNEESHWIAIGGDRLTFISRDNLHLPEVMGALNTTGRVQQMVFFPDKTKLLLVDGGGVAYVDCFDPTTPRLLGRWNTPKTIYGLTLSGAHAYACQGEIGISVLDITNPLKIVKIATLSTQGSAQSIQFNRAHSLAYVADSTGIDIWSMQIPLIPQRISRLNTTGFVSAVALSPDEKSLYFVSEQLLGQVNVSSPSMPTLSGRLDATRPIKNIVLSDQGAVAYLAAETDGMLIVDTKTMQIKSQLASSSAHSIALSEFEDEIYIADMEGGLKVAELINELSIIPLTATTHYPVGIRVEETLLFFDRELQPVIIDKINHIQYVDSGQKRELPLWISVDLLQRKISITAPKELTDKPIQLAISLDINGARQETVYQTLIASSLDISPDKGVVTISTPSPTVSVSVDLTQGHFIPQPFGSLSVSTEDNILQAFGSVADVNKYLQSVRVIPDPIDLNQAEIALNPAQIRATDMINLFPSNAVVRLRSFRFNQPPVVANAMNQTNIKALDSFEITVPPNTFIDPDDPKLTLSAQLVNGSRLPSWLTFNPKTLEFDGIAPVSMLNETLDIKITASDGYLSVNTLWQLHIDANNGPFVAKPAPTITRTTGTEFSYVFPTDIFQDLDNNTLTFNAVQEGYDVLPGFLNFNPDTQTFLGRPTGDDVDTYTIKIRATDKFGASAEATFDINIKFSNWDFFLYVLEKFGIATAIATPFTWAYYNRALLYNTAKRESYWRDEIPKALLEGKAYKPKNPITEAEIEKDNIIKIHIMAIDKDKFGHDFARDNLPVHLYVGLYAKPLLNDERLPTWMELDPDAGSLSLKPEHFPTGDNTYIYQIIGEGEFILESFFIKPAQITMYQAPVGLTILPAFELTGSDRSQSSTLSNVWAGIADTDLELVEILDQRPGNDQRPSADAVLNIESFLAADSPQQMIQQEVAINLRHLLNDDDENPPRLSPDEDKKNSNGTYARFFDKSFESVEARQLKEVLAGRGENHGFN